MYNSMLSLILLVHVLPLQAAHYFSLTPVEYSVYRESLPLSPPSIEAYTTAGKSLFEDRLYDKSEPLFIQAVSQSSKKNRLILNAIFKEDTPYDLPLLEDMFDQDSIESLFYLLMTLHVQEKFHQETKLIQSIPNIETKRARSFLFNTCRKHGQLGEDTIAQYAYTLCELGRLNTALKLYKPLANNNQRFLLDIATLHFKQGEIEIAFEHCKGAAQGGDVRAMYNCGALAFKKGNIAQAKKWLQKAAHKGLLYAINALKQLEKQDQMT